MTHTYSTYMIHGTQLSGILSAQLCVMYCGGEITKNEEEKHFSVFACALLKTIRANNSSTTHQFGKIKY